MILKILNWIFNAVGYLIIFVSFIVATYYSIKALIMWFFNPRFPKL